MNDADRERAIRRAAARLRWTEKDEERCCDDLVAQVAGREAVVRLSQPRASMQTEGIPDRRYRVRGVVFWWEVKTPSGQLSEAQHRFLEAEAACDELAACGDHHNLARFLEVLRKHGRGVAGAIAEGLRKAVAARGFRKEGPRRRMAGRGCAPLPGPPPTAPKGTTSAGRRDDALLLETVGTITQHESDDPWRLAGPMTVFPGWISRNVLRRWRDDPSITLSENLRVLARDAGEGT